MDEVDDILNSDDLTELMGRVEGETLEVKVEPYDLDVASERYELAKDVSAFANAKGGHLILGIGTTREDKKKLDVLSEFNLLGPDDCSSPQYLGVLHEYVHPEMDGLTLKFVATDDENQGIWVLRVPPQHSTKKPFLVSKVVDDNRHLKEIIVGYVRRLGDSSQPLSPRQLHETFRHGLDSTTQRLLRIEEKLDLYLDTKEETEPGDDVNEDLLDSRMEDALADE